MSVKSLARRALVVCALVAGVAGVTSGGAVAEAQLEPTQPELLQAQPSEPQPLESSPPPEPHAQQDAPAPQPPEAQPSVSPSEPLAPMPSPSAKPVATQYVVGVRPLETTAVEREPTDAPGSQEPSPSRLADHVRFATREGASGGLSLVDPSSGEVGSVRLQLTLDSFPEDDFLSEGDGVGQGRQALAASFTPARFVEVFGALLGRGTSSEDRTLGSLHTQGAVLGVKTWTPALAPLHFGGDVRIELHDELGGQLPTLKATSVGLRFATAFDLRETSAELPLRLRGNLEYLLDNSELAAEDVEQARYRALDDPDNRFDETRHLLSRFERYALGISRVDTLSIGLGLEAPLALGDEASLHPIVEWRLGLPVNRRNFNCALTSDPDAGTAQSAADSCAGDVGFASWPSQLSIGVRLAPPVRGLSLSLGAEIGTSGTADFVHELAPTSPLVVMFAIGYTDDARD